MIQFRKVAVSALVLLTFQNQAQAWGPVAHEAVGLIAETQLTKATQTRINAFLDGSRLSHVALWPDANRGDADWAHTKAYHFTSVPDQTDYLTYLQHVSKEEFMKGDVIRALLRAEEILRSNNGSKDEKSVALSYLAHLVGDLHQPLHTGRPEDRGGNDIVFQWVSRRTNLHQVWDSVILESYYASPFQNKPPSTQSGLYARQLLKNLPPEAESWREGFVDTWLQESLEIRPQVYAGPIKDPKRLTLQSIDTVNRRVLQAGLRLGALLNDIFDPTAARREYKSASLRLRQQMAQAVGGDPLKFVSLSPASRTSQLRSPLRNNFRPISFQPTHDHSSHDDCYAE